MQLVLGHAVALPTMVGRSSVALDHRSHPLLHLDQAREEVELVLVVLVRSHRCVEVAVVSSPAGLGVGLD